MKLLVSHPGASYSTADVYDGLVPALEALGHVVVPHRLDDRIERAGGWLRYDYRRLKARGYAGRPPSAADVLYLANYTLLEMALRHRADWVVVISGMYTHPDMLILLRRAGVRVALLLTESPYDDARQARILPYVEVAWTNERTSVAQLRADNPEVHYLRAAFDPARHAPEPTGLDADVPAHDVVIVGTGFPERIELLERVDWTGIDLGLYGSWDLLGSRHRLRRFVRGGITDNATTAALYRRAGIGLNIHRTSVGFGRHAPRIDGAESVNPRLVELAACGAFALSDWRREVDAIFGGHVPTFATAADLAAALAYWLERPDRRAAMAAVLPGRVAGETFAARAAQITADLERVGARLDGLVRAS